MKSQLQIPIERRFRRMVRAHPEYSDAVERVWQVLDRYRIPANQWITDCLFQRQGRRRPQKVDVLFYSELMFQLLKGHLYYTGIFVGCPPKENPKEKILNELTLAAMESPFSVDFVWEDGVRQALLRWQEPVMVHCHRVGEVHSTRLLEPGVAQLETGYARAIETGLALRERKQLARWPNGHRFVYLLCTDEDEFFEGLVDMSQWLDRTT
jgi:hypothetical protein